MSDASFADTDRPLAVDDVEMAVFDGEVVLFRESTRMVHRLNSIAGAVWLVCDGETAVASMADELGEVFGVEPATLTDGIHEALGQLAAEGLFVGAGEPERVYLEPVEELASDGSRILHAPPDP